MKRREFVAAVGGTAAWPVVARGQQAERMRRVGVLMPFHDDDPDGDAEMVALRRGLAEHDIDSAKREHIHLRTPSLLIRPRAQATVRVWKKRPELQAHSRSESRDACGLPVATRAVS